MSSGRRRSVSAQWPRREQQRLWNTRDPIADADDRSLEDRDQDGTVDGATDSPDGPFEEVLAERPEHAARDRPRLTVDIAALGQHGGHDDQGDCE